jgi:hypothetical protein
MARGGRPGGRAHRSIHKQIYGLDPVRSPTVELAVLSFYTVKTFVVVLEARPPPFACSDNAHTTVLLA